MRGRLKHPLAIATLFFLSLVSCNRSTPQVEFAPPPAEPAPAINPGTSRVVPRRATPLIITNPPAPATVGQPVSTNTAPVVTCAAAQTLPCGSADGIPVVLSAQVHDADGNALSVVWMVDGKERHTQQIAAEESSDPVDLTFPYTLTPGDHAIRVTAFDGSLAGLCETTVTIQKDTQEPVIACPADISVPADPGLCTAVVNYSVKATDNCPDVVVAAEPPTGTAFPIGVTAVTCTATDAAGNVSECTFNVSVFVSNRCPRNDGFWRQSPAAWPLSSVRLGNQTYSRTQLLPLLRATVPADASMVLARQLIVATLNTANGADPRPICNELAQANQLLSGFSGKLPYRVNMSSAVGRSMIGLASRLGGYNSGVLTPNCAP